MEKIELKVGEFVTNCMICNITCHFPCHVRDDSNKSKCSAMKNGFCKQCKDKCEWNVHRNMSFRIEIVKTKYMQSIKDMEQEIVSKSSKETSFEQIIKKYEKDFLSIAKECLIIVHKIRLSINKLGKIALKPFTFSSMTEYFKLLIKNEND